MSRAFLSLCPNKAGACFFFFKRTYIFVKTRVDRFRKSSVPTYSNKVSMQEKESERERERKVQNTVNFNANICFCFYYGAKMFNLERTLPWLGRAHA